MSKPHEAPEPWVAWTVAVTIIIGFAVGSVGVVFGWPMFWSGVGVVVLGGLVGWRVHIMAFTEEYGGDGEVVEPGTKMVHG